ncbi:ATPase, partial [Candidatus Woesearchaeota archaeon]
MTEKEWHIMNVEEVIKELQTSLDGLTTEQFKYRQGQYGLNKLKEYKKTSPLKIFFKQFTNFLIIILLIATIVSAFIGEFIDAIVILTIILACALLGFFQEYRSEKAVEALKKLSAPKATVIRNSEEQEIPAEELVPGDLIIVRVGDKVPADARLIEEMNLETDEAVLTGESVPVKKEVSPVLEKGIPIADRKCMIYAGTTVTHGHGKAVVTETGMETEFGKIAKMIQSIEIEKTPLEIRLEHIGKWLGFGCLVVCALASVSGILRGYDYLDMFIWGISLAVAAVPEALPAVVTGALSIGVQRMAKNNAIVKRLPAVETLGCTSVICSDKTGTLTKNEMTVKKIYVNRKTISVTGTGYEPKGKFFHKGKRWDPEKDPHISLLFKIGLLCNDASLRQENGIWKVHGDPTEGALVVVAAKAGFDQESIKEKHPRVGEISFDMIRKRMTTIHPKSEKKQIAYVKGAPELMLNLCTKIYERGRIRKMTPKKKEEILELTKRMASKALRILAFAYREIPVMDKEEYTPENVENNLIFVGLMGMIDPPRKEAISAIRSCTRAGIRPVIVTGDHAITAFAIAKEIKLIKPGEKMTKDILITGPELDELSDEDLERVVDKIKIYARVNPHHKLRIIEALKKKGVIVAMTGDGINDAPALRKADIGISMGITGTDVTKEASDMILADDNFVTIVKAVKEGRAIYDNIK